MTIFQVILSNSILCNRSAMCELQDEFCRSADSQLHSINPFSLIKRFFVAQIISGVLSSANDNLYSAIIEGWCCCTAVIHNNHLLMQVSVFNDDGWCYRVEIRRSRLSCSGVVSRLIHIRFPSHELKSICICIENVIWSLDVQTMEIHCDIHPRHIFFNSFKVEIEFNFVQGDVPTREGRSWESYLQKCVFILIHIALELDNKHLFVLSLICNDRWHWVVPRYRFVLSCLKDVEPFVMICGIISPVISIIVPKVDCYSPLSTFICIIDSQVEQTIFKSIGIMEQMKRYVLVEEC